MLAKIKIESEKIVVFEFGSLCGLREKVLVNRVSYDSSKSDTPLYRPGHFSVSFTGIQPGQRDILLIMHKSILGYYIGCEFLK